MSQKQFKLTYGTMFNPPRELHEGFDKSLRAVKADLGREYGLFINGREVYCADKFSETSPTDRGLELAVFQSAGRAEARPPWRRPRRPSAPGAPRPGKRGWPWCARRPTSSTGAPLR